MEYLSLNLREVGEKVKLHGVNHIQYTVVKISKSIKKYDK